MTARVFFSCVLTLAIPLAAGTQPAGKDYYPLAVGNVWTYQVGDHHVHVRVARTETVEIKVQKPDAEKKLKEQIIKVQAFHLESKSDDRVMTETVAILDDGVYRLAAAGKNLVPPLCILKLPPQASWQVQSMTDDMPVQGTFSAKEEEIEVPAFKGKVRALKTYSDDFQIGKHKMKVAYWFVQKVGLVQQHTHVGAFEVLMKLEKITSK